MLAALRLMSSPRLKPEFVALALALAFAGLALGLRATIDHHFVTLYTGDNGEELTLTAARNFQRFGFSALKFLPVHEEMPGPDLPVRPRYYTHSPPLPPLLVGATYAWSGGSILLSRAVVITFTLVGMVFAALAVMELARGLLPEPGAAAGVAGAVLACLLATSAGVLCYGDALSEVPLQETLQWMTLFFCARFLRSPGSRGLGALAVLAALHVWTGLDWMVALAVILGYCVAAKDFTPAERRRAFLLLFGTGLLLPVLLRLLQNSWALGGIEAAFLDFYGRVRFRAGLGRTYPYDFPTHFVRFSVAMVWLCGLAAPLLIWLHPRPADPARLAESRPILILFWLWGAGSVSWQFLMPQAAMYHAYTVLHPANFVLMWGALSAASLWRPRPLLVISALSLQLLSGGVLFATEIGIPFLRDSSARLTAGLCETDRVELRAAVPDMSSSVSKLIGEQLAEAPPPPPCGPRSTLAKGVLRGYLHVIRFSSLH